MENKDQKGRISEETVLSANKVEFVEGTGTDLDGKGKDRRRMESRVCEAATQPKTAS